MKGIEKIEYTNYESFAALYLRGDDKLLAQVLQFANELKIKEQQRPELSDVVIPAYNGAGTK